MPDPIRKEVPAITPEVYEQAEKEAIETGSVVIVNVVETPDPDIEKETPVDRED